MRMQAFLQKSAEIAVILTSACPLSFAESDLHVNVHYICSEALKKK